METKNFRLYMRAHLTLLFVLSCCLCHCCFAVSASDDDTAIPAERDSQVSQLLHRGISPVASPQPANSTEFHPRYHALLVGVPNLTNDAINANLLESIHDFATLMGRQYGFDTTLLLGPDATLAGLDRALLHLIENLTDEDCLLIYVACASESDRLLDDSYWLSAPEPGAVGSGRSESIGKQVSSRRFLSWIESIQARHILLVTDTIFTWGRRRGESFADADAAGNATAWYQKILSQPSRLVLQRSPKNRDGSAWLLQQLHDLLSANTSPFLAVSELLPELRTRADSDDLQNGRLMDARDSGSGEFVFQRSETEVLPIPIPIPLPVPETGDPVAAAPVKVGLASHVSDRELHESGMQETLGALHSCRAIADFSFDGTLEEALGTGTQLEMHDSGFVFPSIVEQAVTTNGPIRLIVNTSPEVQKGRPRSEALSAAFWLRLHEASGPMCFEIDVDGCYSVTLRTDVLGHLYVDSGVNGVENRWTPRAILNPDRWYHVVVNVKADAVTGFLDGKATEFYKTSEVPVSSEHAAGFELDELKIFEGKLSQREVSAFYAIKYQRFALTKAWAAETEDLDAMCRAEYGDRASMADWRTLEQLYAGEIVEFLDAIGWKYFLGVLLRCDGKRYWEGNRHYSATRFDGFKPDFHLTHETLDEHQLDLGSWFQLHCPVLVQRY